MTFNVDTLYAGYLFDLDGTLVDTAPDINMALNHALVGHGHPGVEESLTRHWVGHGARALITEALKRYALPHAEPDALLAAFISHYEAHIADLSRPYPTVLATLEHLQQRGAMLAVVTNKLERLSRPLLDALDMTGYFASIIGGDSADTPKPAPDPALLACRQLGVQVDRVLFVGDSDTDVNCARAAGCPVVVVRDGYNHGVPANQLGADAVIESFEDLV